MTPACGMILHGPRTTRTTRTTSGGLRFVEHKIPEARRELL
jgi:hypothetical protein